MATVQRTTQAHMPAASTMMEHTPPAKCTPPATIKDRGQRAAVHTCDPRSAGAQGVDGRDNARKSGAPGPHILGHAARHAVDDRRCMGSENRQTTPAATSTAPVHQLLGSVNAETRPAGAQAAEPTKRSDPTQPQGEEWVTLQGPVKKQQPDRMSHRGQVPGRHAKRDCVLSARRSSILRPELICLQQSYYVLPNYDVLVLLWRRLLPETDLHSIGFCWCDQYDDERV